MPISRRLPFASILVAIPLLFTFGGGLQPASASAGVRLAVVPNSTLPASFTAGARFLGQAKPGSTLSLSLGLPLRNVAALDRFDAHLATERPLSPSAFNQRFAPLPSQVQALNHWISSQGMKTLYQAPNGLVTEVRGRVGTIEQALHITFGRFVLNGTHYLAGQSNPSVPASLGISSIVGLNTLQHAVRAGIRRSTVRSGGYFPKDLRAAYGSGGHKVGAQAVDGTGQTIGFTLWGGKVPDADFTKFASMTGDPAIKACTGTGCTVPNAIQWVPVGGTSTDTSGFDETAMDVEYAHAMAPNSRLKYYLAKTSSFTNLSATLAAAASDPTLKFISNSWGGGISGPSDPFVTQTRSTFQQAATEGKTFLFSSGDQALDSGCGGNPNPECGDPSYPSASPYVASIGGTNIQMDSRLTRRTLETTWNYFFNNDYGVEGAGGGCGFGSASLPRPVWQKGVTAAATCVGRAQPDFSADADPQSGALVVTSGKEACGSATSICAEQVGGTSLAAPLWAGMSAEWARYLTLSGKPAPSFLPAVIYPKAWTGSAASSIYHRIFHDVTCGFNGYPAMAGWDQATGWGSPNWLQMAQALAGQTVTMPAKAADANDCVSVTNADQFHNSFSGWPAGILPDSLARSVVAASWADKTSNNVLRFWHKSKYESFGESGGYVNVANIQIASDNTPFATDLETKYPNAVKADAVVKDVQRYFAAQKIPASDCSGLGPGARVGVPDCIEEQFYFTPSGGGADQDVDYYIFAEGNTVGEAYLQADAPTVQSLPQAFGGDALWIALAGMNSLNAATNSPNTWAAAPLSRALAAARSTGAGVYHVHSLPRMKLIPR